MPKRVYLIRHGETEHNREKRFLGSTDAPLTTHGMAQVRRLAGLLPAGVVVPGRMTWCVASPLLRAQQTAQVIAGRFGLDISTDDDLREMDFGAWEGLNNDEIEARFPGALSEWLSPTDDSCFPDGESLGQFWERIARAQARVVERQADTVLVCAHSGAVRALLCGLLGLGHEFFWVFDLRPASVARVDVFERGAQLAELWSVDDRGEG
jgi:broad specificity phosphatase PhoE